MKTCRASCLAGSFRFDELRDHFTARERATLYRDVLHIERGGGEAFCFTFGVMVSWGLDHDEEQRLLTELGPFNEEPLSVILADEFTWAVSTGEMRIHQDHIRLAVDDVLERLAVSHGIAQSIKLEAFEDAVQETIESTADIPRSIAASGRTRLSRKEIARMRGRLHLVSSGINLSYDLLDTPDFFWEYPEYEHCYTITAGYLEVSRRIEILNHKLQVIHELLEMLAEEQNHKHSAALEWIIIWLIAIEVVIFLVHDIFSLV